MREFWFIFEMDQLGGGGDTFAGLRTYIQPLLVVI